MPKLVVVTGASAGIGRATALALADAGLEVLAVARRAADLAALARVNTQVHPVVADVTTAAGQERIRHAVAGRAVEALVHGAGIFPRGRITALSCADWQSAMATNMHARLQLVLALRTQLRGGRVLFIGSDAATTARAGGAAYSVSTAASAMLCRCLATELGGEIAFGIAKPGLVETAMLDESLRTPRQDFPAGAVYAAMKDCGETIAATTVARFFRFLLLKTDTQEFTRDPWDIRDAVHHPRWLAGPLFVARASSFGAPEESGGGTRFVEPPKRQ